MNKNQWYSLSGAFLSVFIYFIYYTYTWAALCVTGSTSEQFIVCQLTTQLYIISGVFSMALAIGFGLAGKSEHR